MKSFTFNFEKQLDFLDYIRNKKVIIVGPSPHLEGRGLGKLIDSYDVVCRVNECYTESVKEDYGKRCDVVFLGNISDDTKEKLGASIWLHNTKEKPIDWFVVPQSISTEANKLSRMMEFFGQFRSVKTSIITHDWWDAMCKQMDVLRRDFTPYAYGANTGVLSILYLLEFIDTFDIAGFSFYNEGLKADQRHHSAYREHSGDEYTNVDLDGPWCIHDPFKQADHIKTLMRDASIRVDPYMAKHIFKESKVIQ